MDLYNKYRPAKFSDMANTSPAIAALEKAGKSNSFAKVYIFHGAHGLGKTTAADILPLAINCTGSGSKPCFKCEGCKMVAEDMSLCLSEINASDYRGIDNVRTLAHEFEEVGIMRMRKVYVLNEAEQMTKDAQKALKDPLEKLNPYTYVVMTTNNLKGIIPEIQDRAQVYSFHGLTPTDAIKLITSISEKENIRISHDQVAQIVALSEGRKPRGLIQLLQRFRDEGESALTAHEEIDDSQPIGRLLNTLIYKDPSAARFGDLRTSIQDILDAEGPEALRIIVLGATRNLLMNSAKLDNMNASVKKAFADYRYDLITSTFLPDLSYSSADADVINRIYKIITQIRGRT